MVSPSLHHRRNDSVRGRVLLHWSLGINSPWGGWADYSNSAQNSISAGQIEAAELSSKTLALWLNFGVHRLCGPHLTIMAISVMGSLLKFSF